MSKVLLPYILREGQVAYASRVMANLNSLAEKLNGVSIPGLPDTDMEEALTQLKYLLDKEAQTGKKAVAKLEYDASSEELILTREDGGKFSVSMSPFIDEFSGTTGDTVQVTVDGNNQISARLLEAAVSYSMLNTALQQLIDEKITANAAGNAENIIFNDGSSFQEKLDAGELNGPAGASIAIDSMYYFHVGDDGHLYVSLPDGMAKPPFSIDEAGQLIYTID